MTRTTLSHLTREFLNEIATDSPFESTIRSALSNATFWPTFRNNQQMVLVMKRALQKDSCCIDVGANRGEILRNMLRFAPNGHHIAIEPVPEVYQQLQTTYGLFRNVDLRRFAASSRLGEAPFYHVRENPRVSGFCRRGMTEEHWRVEQITVPIATIDSVVPAGRKIDLIKIDVEGAEEQVLRGAVRTIERWKPKIIFEHNRMAAPYFHTTPNGIYRLLVGRLGMRLYTLGDWLQGKPSLTEQKFEARFDEALERDYLAA